MKPFAIALLLVFAILSIFSNANSTSKKSSSSDRRDSYNACLRLRSKGIFKLNCEKLIESEDKVEKVKILSNAMARTRKVNKIEEIKLRNYLNKLYNEH